MNADIYERHRQAVAGWRKACDDVTDAELRRDAARRELDEIGQELLASCADSKKVKPIVKRVRKAKVNGLDKIDAERAHTLSGHWTGQ